MDAPLHLEGRVVVQAGQEASLEVVQGQHAVEIYLVHTIKDVNHIIWLITQKSLYG